MRFVRRRDAGASRIPGPALSAFALLLSLAAAGCSSPGDRRLSEFEAQEYKRALVLESGDELTEGQKLRLMAHPARTEQGLNEALEGFREETRRRRAAEAAKEKDLPSSALERARVLNPGAAARLEELRRGTTAGAEDRNSS